MNEMPIQGKGLSTLKQLCRSSIEAGIRKLCEIETWPRPPAARKLRVGYDFYYKDLEDIQEVNNLVQYLASDDKIKSIYFRQPSTPELYILYEYWEQLLLKILGETEGISLNNRVFYKWFRMFLKELYSATAVWRSVDTITGLTLRGANLKFDQATTLTFIPGYKLRDIIWGQERYIYDNWIGTGLDKATIITTVRIPKCQYAGSTTPYPHLTKHIERHLAAIDAIRLTKSGAPRLHCFAEFQLSHFPVSTPLAYCDREAHHGLYEKEAILDKSDFPRIRNLWRELMDTRYKEHLPKRFKIDAMDIALGRFSKSYGLQSWLEDVVDLTIALESLFKPKDSTQELSHRIAMRAAWLLGLDEKDSEDSAKVYDRIRTMYNIRSSTVHGETPDESKLSKWLEDLSGDTYDRNKGYHKLVEPAVESARNIVRRAIRGCMKLSKLGANGPHWPFPPNFDKNIVDTNKRRMWQQAAGVKSKR